MGRAYRYLLGAVVALICAPALFAQNAVVLGTVYDKNGKGMPAVSILLENSATGFARVATTGADGSYTVAEVPPAGDQLYVYGLVPELTETVADPVLSPKHSTSWCAEIVAFGIDRTTIFTVSWPVQPVVSVKL